MFPRTPARRRSTRHGSNGTLVERLGLEAASGARLELLVLEVQDPDVLQEVEDRARRLGVSTSERSPLLACQGHTVLALVRDLRRSLSPADRARITVVFPTTPADERPSLDAFADVHSVDLDALLAVGSDALFAVFQPVVELATGRVAGYEGLIRGRQGGQVLLPSRLFPLARSPQRLAELDRAATLATLRDAAPWLDGAQLYLNFTPSTFDPERVQDVARTAFLLGIPHSSLVLEIVESERIGDLDTLLAAAKLARRLGMRIALDDVGAGYASLELVCGLGPEIVKVSMALTHQLPRSQGVIAGLCLAADHAGADVVLEGIETAEQDAHARELGVGYGQGYWYGRPAVPPPGELETSAAWTPVTDAGAPQLASVARRR